MAPAPAMALAMAMALAPALAPAPAMEFWNEKKSSIQRRHSPIHRGRGG
jgi:hypothetical protein